MSTQHPTYLIDHTKIIIIVNIDPMKVSFHYAKETHRLPRSFLLELRLIL